MPFITARVLSVVRDDAIAALANAGPDQSVLCASLVQLQASIVGDDIENHTFEWEQTFGTPVTLINANTLTPSFVNPQVSDLEFTFYLDRNTPYEDSDTVFISRAPQDAMTFFGEQGTKGLGGAGAVTQSNLASTNVVATDKGLRVLNPTVDGYSYTNPPEAKYSPIFKASDLDRVRKNVKGAYWLMNDIDLSEYSNWEPIGTATKPFIGELQGNGFSIDNLTITDTAKKIVADPPILPNASTLTLTDSLITSGDITSFPNSINWTLDGLYCAIPRDTDYILWYSASTAFDFNTLTLDTTITPNYSLSNRIHQVVFKPDGTKAYLSDYNFANVYEFDLSTPYDLTEIHGAAPNQTFSPVGKAFHLGIWFKQDGTRMYVCDDESGDSGITSYTLSTPWDITTATETSRVITSAAGLNIGRCDGVIASEDGTRMWAVFPNSGLPAEDKIRQINLSTPYDLSTATLDPDTIKINEPGLIWQTGLSWSPGRPDDIWVAYTAGSRTLRRLTGILTGLGTVYDNAGLFSYIGDGALIEKVGVTNANISGIGSTLYKGILAGQATSDVTVRDCYVSGTVDSGGDRTGGLIGDTGTDAGTTFTNTYADVTVTGGGTDTGGWAGTFSGTPTYVENYGNTTKTASVVGTGAPGATEVSGLTTAQLTAEANYTDWDFTSTWEIDEGVSAATLQFDTNNNIRIGGFCDDQWMVQWGIPTYSNNTSNPPAYIYKGAIVEERVAGGWSLPRFIPPERNAALMTPDTPHRVTAVWDFYYNSGFELRRFPSLYTAVKEVGVTDDRLFNSQNTSDRYGLYGTDSYTIVNGSASSATNFTITISNPRKIAKTENELLTVNGSGAESTQAGATTLLRTTPIQKPTQDSGTIGGAGSASYSDNLTVTRVNGASIG